MAGTLTIGVVTGVTPDKWVRVWRDRMPQAALRIVPVEHDDARAGLGDGVDMVFARLPLPEGLDADAHVIPLWEETPVVVAAKDHPVKVFDAVVLADLADEQQHEGWSEGVLDVVAAGHGVVLMPQSVFRASGRRDLVARPVTDAPPTRIGLVWLPSAPGPLVDEFIGVVRGRTANSSRGAAPPPSTSEPPAKGRPRTGGAGRGGAAKGSGATRAGRRPGRPTGRGRG